MMQINIEKLEKWMVTRTLFVLWKHCRGIVTSFVNERLETEQKDRWGKLAALVNSNGNIDEIFRVGRECIKNEPEYSPYALSVLISLTIQGHGNVVVNKIERVALDAAHAAQEAIRLLDLGIETGTFGEEGEYADRLDALGNMHFLLGFLLYHHLQSQVEGVGHLYRASQIKSSSQFAPDIYQAIGEWYLKDAQLIGKTAQNRRSEEETEKAIELEEAAETCANLAMDAYLRDFIYSPEGGWRRNAYLSELKRIYSVLFDGIEPTADRVLEAAELTLCDEMPDPLSAPSIFAEAENGTPFGAAMTMTMTGYVRFCFQKAGEMPPSDSGILRLLRMYYDVNRIDTVAPPGEGATSEAVAEYDKSVLSEFLNRLIPETNFRSVDNRLSLGFRVCIGFAKYCFTRSGIKPLGESEYLQMFGELEPDSRAEKSFSELLEGFEREEKESVEV